MTGFSISFGPAGLSIELKGLEIYWGDIQIATLDHDAIEGAIGDALGFLGHEDNGGQGDDPFASEEDEDDDDAHWFAGDDHLNGRR